MKLVPGVMHCHEIPNSTVMTFQKFGKHEDLLRSFAIMKINIVKFRSGNLAIMKIHRAALQHEDPS